MRGSTFVGRVLSVGKGDTDFEGLGRQKVSK